MPITMADIDRAAAEMDRQSQEVREGPYVIFVHPAREYSMRREWAREQGSPIRQHDVRRGLRARRRARLSSWRPNRLPQVAWSVERIVVGDNTRFPTIRSAPWEPTQSSGAHA